MEIPAQLQHLQKDKRGFPIPYVVLIDKDGQPHFKVNDTSKSRQCGNDKICHICGKKLNGEFWFIGGQVSAFHPQGAFNDGAVHKVCGIFALQVCPYMAYSQYKGMDMKGIERLAEKLKGNTDIKALYNPTQTDDRLAFFVFAKAKSYIVSVNYLPKRPYEQIEYWLDGKRIHKAEAKQLLKDKNEKSYLQ